MRLEPRQYAFFAGILVIAWFGVVYPKHYTEGSVLDSTIDDPVFGGLWETHRHVTRKYFNESSFHSMKQSDRLDLLVEALNVSVRAMEQVNLQTFIDAGVLLGWYRHHGKMIPWDIDADIGILTDECLEKYPDQAKLEAKLRSVLPHPYVLEYINCRPEHRKEGQEFAGIITDSRNGMKVDIFGFNTVDGSSDHFSWRRKRPFLQRDLDADIYHKVIPRDAILPLRWGNFSGITGNIIPNDAKRFLQWDFGFVIDPPIFPHGFSRMIDLSILSVVLVAICVACYCRLTDAIACLCAICILGGGYRLVALTLLLVGPALRLHKGSTLLESAVWYLAIISLFSDFLPLGPQLFATLMETIGAKNFTTNKERLCILYKLLCVDT
jgi:hypothetical protein